MATPPPVSSLNTVFKGCLQVYLGFLIEMTPIAKSFK